MATSAFGTVRLQDIVLTESPIEPSWILHGDPRARSAEWSRSADGTTSMHVWDCTEGTFRWHFGQDEVIHIMEGSVSVGRPDRTTLHLEVGDAAFFGAGTWSEWHVSSYVRKHAILHQHVPAPMMLPLRAIRKVLVLTIRPRLPAPPALAL